MSGVSPVSVYVPFDSAAGIIIGFVSPYARRPYISVELYAEEEGYHVTPSVEYIKGKPEAKYPEAIHLSFPYET